ncbi:MAG: glycosyltransferase family 2 protein [Candidatus Krumholzibacteriia bacterium]
MSGRPTVCVIIPCFNEADGLAQLRVRLVEALPRLAATTGAVCGVLLFDNGSTDATLAGMRRSFGDDPRFTIHHSPVNRGIGGALRDALALSDADILATMDADCTYDPLALGPLVAALVADGWDVATGSPYHPRGAVLNVPAWRLVLSRGLSRLYWLVAPLKLWTYTSMFRAYRREVLRSISWSSDGFLSTSEILMEAAAGGFTIFESPTTLATRRFGQSKIRILRVMGDHLDYLRRLATDRGFRARLRQNFRAAPATRTPVGPTCERT